MNPQNQITYMTQVTSFKIQGVKGVLVELQKYPEDLTTGNIFVPKYENYETDGGKPAAKIKEELYSSIAKVLQISDAAKNTMEESFMDVQVGDYVLIQDASRHFSNWFILSPNHPVADFDGKLLIHPNSILAKLEINEN
jgi:hypothetical protein